MSKLLFVTDELSKATLHKRFKAGELRRILHGVYADDFKSSSAEIIKQNWQVLIPHKVPSGILSYRSAHDLRLIPYNEAESVIFVTSTYDKTIKLPGLIIKVIRGITNKYIEQILPNLARSNETRMLLENLSKKHQSAYQDFKTIGQEGVEIYLAKCLNTRHEVSLNKIRDEAKLMAPYLGLEYEFDLLNKIITRLLATHVSNGALITDYAAAISNKQPYDSARINTFNELSLYLRKCQFIRRDYAHTDLSFKTLSFFETYFSNYIEGTKFLIDEAETIVFSGKEIENRYADTHDVLANFYISNDYLEMQKTPTTYTELVQMLQERHAVLMHERPEVNPGRFKEKNNMAGNTLFVRYQDVAGTLRHGFEIYKLLADGMQKALFMHFMISEVHPFNDGNGRIARIMLNSELVNSQQYKIIMPTVYRDSYLLSLRMATRDSNFATYCKVMDVAQAYTASIPWFNYIEARAKIEIDEVNLSEDEALSVFNRVIRQLVLSGLPLE